MKRNKAMVMTVSFCLGAVMLVTTAFADIAAKSGYDQLKDTVKQTAENCSKNFNSFTMDASISLKDGDKIIMTENAVDKFDNTTGAAESINNLEDQSGIKSNSYSYRDNDCSIYYDSQDKTYYVTELTSKREKQTFDNPFEEDRVKDLEKILDALVGNLRDYVVVEDKTDGSKELSGSLNETQIPALVNAVSSFVFKQKFVGTQRSFEPDNDRLPQLSQDIYIKKVTGKANVNKDGILESILAAGVLSGKDKDGNIHDLNMEMLIKIYDINSTIVKKPDMSESKVEVTKERNYAERTVDKKFVGKYSSNIIVETDTGWDKIGERFVEIAHVDGKNVAGRYYEKYLDEKSDYAKNVREFSFDAEIQDNSNAVFQYTTPSGEQETANISFDLWNAKLYLNIPYHDSGNGPIYDSEFLRVFDN